MSFFEIIEEIKTLPTEDKIEVKELIVKFLIEERRKEIYNNYLEAKKMEGNGDLIFTSETDELMNMLENVHD
ncbi:MAG: hypothetical protein NT007_18005 [Candidatus Kapabacteria bacterium]|nr:hypothetical protein [Candidatus Kapabacteria bacterium]